MKTKSLAASVLPNHADLENQGSGIPNNAINRLQWKCVSQGKTPQCVDGVNLTALQKACVPSVAATTAVTLLAAFEIPLQLGLQSRARGQVRAYAASYCQEHQPGTYDACYAAWSRANPNVLPQDPLDGSTWGYTISNDLFLAGFLGGFLGGMFVLPLSLVSGLALARGCAVRRCGEKNGWRATVERERFRTPKPPNLPIVRYMVTELGVLQADLAHEALTAALDKVQSDVAVFLCRESGGLNSARLAYA